MFYYSAFSNLLRTSETRVCVMQKLFLGTTIPLNPLFLISLLLDNI